MTIPELIEATAKENNITPALAKEIIDSYYDDFYGVLYCRQGARVRLPRVVTFKCMLNGAQSTMLSYVEDIMSLIGIRNGKVVNPFYKVSGYIWACHRVINVLGGMVISQIDSYYNVNKGERRKKGNVNTVSLVSCLYWLDRLIGNAFSAKHCAVENNLSQNYLRRVHTKGLLLRFRKDFNVPPCSEMQKVWLCAKVEDSLIRFPVPDTFVVRPRKFSDKKKAPM